MNKRGSGVGDMVEMIPFLAMVSLVAVVVFGVSASAYGYDVSVRDVEARLMVREMSQCLIAEGVIDLDKIGEDYYDNVFSYCGLREDARFYIGVEVEFGEPIFGIRRSVDFSEGDSGSLWIRDLFTGAVVLTGRVVGSNEHLEKMAKYQPGYYISEYPVFVLKDGKEVEGEIKVEALVNYDLE